MKRYIYATSIGIIILGSTAIQSTFAANTNRATRTLATELSTLTDDDLDTLETMSGSKRDRYIQNKIATYIGSSNSGETIMAHVAEVELTESELQSLESMTQSDREAFWAAKGITRPTTSGETITRATRIAQNQSRLLEEKKQRIERKIQAGEKLTRIEKKFAKANKLQ